MELWEERGGVRAASSTEVERLRNLQWGQGAWEGKGGAFMAQS